MWRNFMWQNLWCLHRLDGGAADVHDLQVLGATFLHAKTALAELVANGVLLFVGQRRIGNDEIVQLIKELCNAVRLVLNVLHVILQLTVVASLANIQKFLEKFVRHQTGQLEDVVSRNFAVTVAVSQSMAGLQRGDGTTHITVRNVNNELEHIFVDGHILFATNQLQTFDHFGRCQRLEAEFRATRGNRLDDARHIIAHQTEARRFALLFHCATQRRLRCMGHRVGFVEYYYFEGWTRSAAGMRTILWLVLAAISDTINGACGTHLLWSR